MGTRPQTLGSHHSPLPNSKVRSSIKRTPIEVRRVLHKTGTKTLSKNVGLPAWLPPVRRECSPMWSPCQGTTHTPYLMRKLPHTHVSLKKQMLSTMELLQRKLGQTTVSLTHRKGAKTRTCLSLLRSRTCLPLPRSSMEMFVKVYSSLEMFVKVYSSL